jgi:hypothetical protein
MNYQTILVNMLFAMIALKIYRFKGVKPETDWLANLAALLMLDYFFQGVLYG